MTESKRSEFDVMFNYRNLESVLVNQKSYLNNYKDTIFGPSKEEFEFFETLSIEACKKVIPQLLENENIVIYPLPAGLLFPYLSTSKTERILKPVLVQPRKLPLFTFGGDISEMIEHPILMERFVDEVCDVYLQYINENLNSVTGPNLIGIYVPFILGKLSNNDLGIITRFARTPKYLDYKPVGSFNYDEGPE